MPVRTSSRYQVFEKLLWRPSEDASQKMHELGQSPVDHNLTQWKNRGPQHHDGSSMLHKVRGILLLHCLKFNSYKMIIKRAALALGVARGEIRYLQYIYLENIYAWYD